MSKPAESFKEVRLTKTSALFGRFAEGSHLVIRVPADLGGEQETKIRARRMMERDHPDENQMEWEAEIVGKGEGS